MKLHDKGEKTVWIVLGKKFEIDSRYEILDPIG
jgi:hypothetical protein